MNILVVDDHALFREGLSLLLSKLFPSTTVREAKDIEDAFSELRNAPTVDLMLLDLMMPGMEGFEGLHRLKAKYAQIPVAILSMSDALEDIRTAIENGASGYILKSADQKILEIAVTLLLSGHVYVPPHALTMLSGKPSGSFESTLPNRAIDSLTPREREVLVHLMEGHPNKVIGKSLNVLEGTIKKHAHAIFRKLGAANRTQAVVIARKQGFEAR